MSRRLSLAFSATVLALALATTASAHDCAVAKKPARAGAAGVVDVTTGQFTPLKKNPGTEDKPHGAFIALEGGGVSTSTFVHAPEGVLPPTRPGGSQANCDGKGLESLEACFAAE